jgi:ComF family protein
VKWIGESENTKLFERYKREAAIRGIKVFFSGGMACWEYQTTARKLILALKYGGGSFLTGDIAKILRNGDGRSMDFAKDSLLVPVPMHYFKRLRRDYNQAELIADAFAKCANSRVERDLLVCKNHTPQVACSVQERLSNVRNVFKCRKSTIDRNARIVIVDDVITTGATVFACCAALHRQGFRNVNVLTLVHG